MHEFTWKAVREGFVAIRCDRAIFFKMHITQVINEETNSIDVDVKYESATRLNFILPDSIYLKLNNCFGTPSPSNVVLEFHSGVEEHLMLVWDLKRNTEKMNFSFKGDYGICYSKSWSSCILLNQNAYINMDTGIPNYFFDINFGSRRGYGENGYKMSEKEIQFISEGKLVLKNLYIDIARLEEYIYEKSEIESGTLSIDKIKFQHEGNTILHLYANDADKLKVILEFLEEKHPPFLFAILIKNYKGRTPLDIAIETDSQRSVDIFFQFLAHFNESVLSSLIHRHFHQLFQMNLKSFHEYLDSWFFRTFQMKNIKYLSMLQDKEVLMLSHSSWILDLDFMEKHTKGGKSEKGIRDRSEEVVKFERKIAEKRREVEEARKKKEEDVKKEQEAKPKRNPFDQSSKSYEVDHEEISVHDKSSESYKESSKESDDSEEDE